MKRTCSNGVLDFDAMNAFLPDGEKPFCQFTAAGYGSGTDSRTDGPFVQTDDTGLVRLRDMAFKMLCDMCVRAGLDALRYLYAEAARGSARDDVPEGRVMLGGNGTVPEMLDGIGLSHVMLPDLSLALEYNMGILDRYDVYSELKSRGTDGPLGDLAGILDAFLYIAPGCGTFLNLLDGLEELMGSMPADDLRMFTNAFYMALSDVPPMEFSGYATRHVSVEPVHAAAGMDGAAPGFREFTVPARPDDEEDREDAAVTDDGSGVPEGDLLQGGTPVEQVPEPSADDADRAYDGHSDGEGAAEDGTDEETGMDEEIGTDELADGSSGAAPDGGENPAEKPDAQDETENSDGGEDPDDERGMEAPEVQAEADGGDAGGSEGAGQQDVPAAEPAPAQEPEPEPAPSVSHVRGMSVGDLVGADETYTSDYESERYERELEHADPDGLLEATVKARANGTDGPIDVLTLRSAVSQVFQPGDVLAEREAQNLRDHMGSLRSEAVDAAGGEENL